MMDLEIEREQDRPRLTLWVHGILGTSRDCKQADVAHIRVSRVKYRKGTEIELPREHAWAGQSRREWGRRHVGRRQRKQQVQRHWGRPRPPDQLLTRHGAFMRHIP